MSGAPYLRNNIIAVTIVTVFVIIPMYMLEHYNTPKATWQIIASKTNGLTSETTQHGPFATLEECEEVRMGLVKLSLRQSTDIYAVCVSLQ